MTQVVIYIFLYICGDLSAQLLFPPGKAKVQGEEGEKENQPSKEATETSEDVQSQNAVSYDPWRTLRQVIVGIGSSVPSFKW